MEPMDSEAKSWSQRTDFRVRSGLRRKRRKRKQNMLDAESEHEETTRFFYPRSCLKGGILHKTLDETFPSEANVS